MAGDQTFENYRKPTRRDEFLKTMEAIVPWVALGEVIEPHYPKAGNGRPPIGLESMLPIHFIEHWSTSAGKAAALLSAKDPQAALVQHEQQHAKGGVKPLGQVSATVRAQLDANQKLMQQLGSSATPTIFYKDASGNLQRMQGAPPADMLVTMMGPR